MDSLEQLGGSLSPKQQYFHPINKLRMTVQFTVFNEYLVLFC